MEKKSLVRVMTFNIRHARGMNNRVSLRRIQDEISRGEAHIVALQEVDRFNARSWFRDQVRVIARSLEMNWCFSDSIHQGMFQYGNAILSRFPLEGTNKIFLPGKERRSILRSGVVIDERIVRVVNTHLSVNAVERSRQFPMLMASVDKLDPPVVLMGDFNMEYHHRLFLQMSPRWQRVAPQPKTATYAGGQEIDHIFVNVPGLKGRAWVQETDASDHHAVLAEIPLDMLHYSQDSVAEHGSHNDKK
ncbi:endonuclease/exonuclease/phosphatase family protein [Ferviditalea candida]|uniref:Endonuclease/exonuclease/phosphatase family protein n=1 Tax=Ferviditalea candida TaxID=3108399 RepID=A0ABU5ZEI6_9BACL|nr:endonuclease/exonuclease/phosphatase family protein [Paenibacillaceae bacterium T2]